jgi:ribonuclease HII
MLIAGIDENGLGPLLGPLVVTGASFVSRSYDRQRFQSLAGPDLPAADSKVIFAPRRAAAAEDAVLRWLDVFGYNARDTAELEEKIVAPAPFEARCPSRKPAICAGDPLALPRAATRRSGVRSAEVRERFDRAGIAAGRVASHVLCAGAFNRVHEERRMNKLRLDFSLMMSVARHLCRGEGAGGDGDALVLCGKVGGTASYGAWLEEEGLDVAEVLLEGRDESAYEVRGLGRIRFLRDGDAAHLPIAVASMVGKYLRELAMERLNRALGREGKTRVSGYRDRVTARFVAETAAERAAAGIVDDCFLRRV